jgi:hypothetical protein
MAARARVVTSLRLVTAPRQLVDALRHLVIPKRLDGLLRSGGGDENLLVGLPNKVLIDRLVHPLNDAVPVTVNVQEADAVLVDAQLVPGGGLEDLLHGAVAAAKSDEAAARSAGEDLLGHELLARVHVGYDGGATKGALIGDELVVGGDGLVSAIALILDEGLGDDAVDGLRAIDGAERLGDLAHQTDSSAAVDLSRLPSVKAPHGGETFGLGRTYRDRCYWLP